MRGPARDTDREAAIVEALRDPLSTLTTVAEHFDITKQRVHQIMQRSGQVSKPRRNRLPLAIALFRAGLTAEEVARRVDLPERTVKAYGRLAGFRFRSRLPHEQLRQPFKGCRCAACALHNRHNQHVLRARRGQRCGIRSDYRPCSLCKAEGLVAA